MSSSKSHIRQGQGSVRPYLHGPVDLPKFLEQVFGAVELERFEFGPGSFHVELRIEDATVVVEAGDLPPDVQAWTGAVYVYVPDVDAVYARAMALGAKPLTPIEDKPYQERQASFIDGGGNTWWIATFKR